MKTIGFTSLAALTLIASTSMVSFASTESNKTAKTSESATTVKPDQIFISKSADGISIQTTTTDNLNNVDLNKAEPAKADSDKAK